MELQTIRNNVQILLDNLCPSSDDDATDTSADSATSAEEHDDAPPAVSKGMPALPPPAGSIQPDLHAPFAASVRPPPFLQPAHSIPRQHSLGLMSRRTDWLRFFNTPTAIHRFLPTILPTSIVMCHVCWSN